MWISQFPFGSSPPPVLEENLSGLLLLLLLLLHPFNGLFSRTTCVRQHQKGKPFWILLEQEIMGGTGIWRLVERGFSWAGYQTMSVEGMKGTQSSNHNQWPGFILSSSTTGFLVEWALLPLLSDTSSIMNRHTHTHNRFTALFLEQPG